MPRVPVYDTRRVQQGSAPAQYDNSDVRAGGTAELAQALNRLGGTYDKVAAEAQAKADAAAVADAETEFQSSLNQSLYSSDGGFLTLQGKNAVASSTDVYSRAEAKRESIAGKLNDRQAEVFRRRTDGTLLQTQRQIESHTAQQIQVAQEDAYKAKLADSLDTVANAYNNPDVREREARNAEAYVIAEAKTRGLDEKSTARRLTEWRSAVAKTTLDRMLSVQDPGATEYFAAHKETLGVDADQYQAKVAKVTTAKSADTLAAGVVAKHTSKDKDAPFLNADAARAEIIAMEPGPLKDAALERFDYYAAAKDKEKHAFIKERVGTAELALQRSGTIPPIEEKWLELHAKDELAKLYSDRRALYRQMRTSNAEARREQRDADQAALYDFKALGLSGMAEADLDDFARGRGMSPTAKSQLGALRTQAKEHVEKGLGVRESEVRTIARKEAGAAVPKAKLPGLDAYMTRWYGSWVEQHGDKPPSRKDVQEAVADALLYGDKNGDDWFGGSSRFKFEAPEGEAFVPFKDEDQKIRRGGTAAPEAKPAAPAAPAAPTMPAAQAQGPKPAPAKPKKQRALELKKEGKSLADIANILTNEGY